MQQTALGWWRRSPLLAVTLCIALLAGAAPAQAGGTGNASINLTKTVGSATFNANLSLTLAVDKATAIPADKLTYSSTVTNTGSTFTIVGQFHAQNNGNNVMATVADYYDDIEYYTSSTKVWTALAGTQATQSGYTPVIQSPTKTGMTLTALPVPSSGVTYPASGDPILGTQIAASSVATWNYSALISLSPSQIATLSDPTKVNEIRNVVHFEVTPRDSNQGQPFTYKQDFTDPFLTQAAAVTNVVVTITLPAGAPAVFDSSSTPALSSISPGKSVTVTSTYIVPQAPAKQPGQSDASYFLALAALEGAQLKASAAASGSSNGSTATAPAPAPVTSVEHLPIVSIAKSGPSTVTAGTNEVNPLTLDNTGGATASSLMVVDSVPSGANGTVAGLPTTLASGATASATATYPVPAGQAPGDLTDTATLTWRDANGNSYGPVSSSFKTTVKNNLAGASLTLAPAVAGPDVVGTTQTFSATLLDSTGAPIANQAVIFGVSGPNATSVAATTNAAGIAIFSYGGTSNGADQVQASATAGSVTLQSNTVTLNWIIPIVPASTTLVTARVYNLDCNCFNVTSGWSPVFTQQFPTINFNPPTGSIPHMPPSIGSDSRPVVSVATDVAGNYAGSTIVQGTDANGVLHQAGANDLYGFQVVFTGSLTVAKSGPLLLSFFSDDGFFFGTSGGTTYVSGSLVNVPPSGTTALDGYPVVAAFNGQSGPQERDTTVNFPAPGSYAYEIDYWECCGDGLAFTFGTGGNAGMPPTGNILLSPATLAAKQVGQSQTVNVAAMDASGVALPNLGISLNITGANPQQKSAPTDSTGFATFTYQSANAGTDTLQASSTVSGVFEISNVVTMSWNPAPPAPTITLPSPADGSMVSKPVPISATFAPPAGQTIASWRVTYQALDPGAVVSLASGTGTPPATLATFDPTLLPNDSYAINITATASGGGVQTITTTVVVFGYLKPGRYVTTYQDMNVPVFGFQMQVRRTYDSFDKEQGDFGVGWRVSINDFRTSANRQLGAGGWTEYNKYCALGLCLSAFQSTVRHFVTVVWPDGHTEVFDFTADGGTNIFYSATPVYTARPGTGTTSTLSAVGDTSLGYLNDGNLYDSQGHIYDPQQFKLTTHDGTVIILDKTRGLVSMTNRDGESFSLSASGFTSPSGRGIAFTRDASGRITQVTGPASQVLTYTYSAAGDLASFIDAVGNVTTFTYDSNHDLLSADGPAGQPLQTEQYDSSGRLIAITDANGNTAQITNNVAGRQQTVIDPSGRLTTVFTFDDLGDVIRQDQVFDGKTLTTTATYDAVGRPLTRTDPLGNTWNATYDANGDLLTVTDPFHNGVTVTYDAFGAPLTFKDSIGNVSTYAYDSSGNLITFKNALDQTDHYAYSGSFMATHTDALNRTWSYNPDGAGNINAIRDPLGNTPSWAYNSQGEITVSRDAAGNATTYTYDAMGNLLTVTDPLGHVTTLAYDALNELVSRTDALGKTTTYTYDGNRQLTSTTDPLGNVIKYTYDADGRLATKTDPAGAVTTYTYDGSGRLTSEKDAIGRVTSYVYDGAGRLTSKTMPNGGVFTYGYDAAGHQTSATDPLGHKTSYAYDADGRLVSVTDPLNRTTTYTLDALGRQTVVTDALGGTTQQAYDVAGQLVSDTDALGKATSYGYDGAGNRTSVTDPLGHTTRFQYDQDNRVNQVTDPLNRFVIYNYDALSRITSTRLFSGIVTSSSFDADGRLSSTVDGLGDKTSYTYDAAGRQASMTDPRGNTTTYGYDPAGRQTSITDALNGKVLFAYVLAGQQTSVTNPRGDVTSTTYDPLGNELTQTDPANKITTFTYDLTGRLTSKTDPRGVTVNNTYDAADRLTGIAFPGAAIALTYDALGRRTAMTDPTGTTNYAYDAASRLTSVGTGQGTVGYAYDAAGNRTSMSIPGRGTITYAYDAANQLTTLTDWANHVFSFTYAPDGMPASITRPGNVSTYYGYDGADRLTSVHHDTSSRPVAHYDYTLDADGNRTSMTSAAGTEKYTLDALNRLTAVSYPNGDSTSYSYDAAGNRLSSTFNGSTTSYTYDSAGRLVAQGGKALTYDAAGNAISIGSDTYTWDWAGRLASSTVGGITSSYTYDGDGVRVGQDIAGSGTNYVWDRAGSLPLLVDDGMQGYVQTDQGVLEQQGSTTNYPLADALGSVRTVETPTPSVSSTTSYDVFGSVRAQSGQQSIFGFTGQQTDSTGLSFLEARYYNPSLGRFVSPDSVQPNAPGTQGYDLYAYVSNNPTTMIDPTGRGELLDTALIRTVTAPVAAALRTLGGQLTYRQLIACTSLVVAAGATPAPPTPSPACPWGPLLGVLAKILWALTLAIVGTVGTAQPAGEPAGGSDTTTSSGSTTGSATTTSPAPSPAPAPAPGGAGAQQGGGGCLSTGVPIPSISRSSLPAEALETIRLIMSGGPYPYPEDGQPFANREGCLPPGKYTEYTVSTPGLANRGSRRIVRDEITGRLYYTTDHYVTFNEVGP
jgi:RHS repeat-associated protein